MYFIALLKPIKRSTFVIDSHLKDSAFLDSFKRYAKF